MENASKALIIAGAILLSILLITLGIIVYRQASGVIDNNAMDEVAVSAFNQKFQQYEGSNVIGTQVNALISTIIQNNLSNIDDTSKQVSVGHIHPVNANNWSGTAKDYTYQWIHNNDHYAIVRPTDKTKVGSALSGKSYSVECYADEKSGYIYYIDIAN